jgi:NAD(P)-dependent dehydrogenase (short-subunit alcohol dehydrogenase family)/acyl carrier protein
VIQAEQASLHGLAKVIPQEMPQLRCRVVDIENNSLRAADTVDFLVGEAASEAVHPVVALRNGYRWVQTYQPLDSSAALREGAGLRPDGVYLITGGLGQVGLALAAGLARRARARLILTTRSAFPPKAEWAERLALSQGPDLVADRIRRLQEIEAMGARVLVCTADVADRAQMREVLTQGEKQFGELNGVIHAAGLTEGSSVRSLDLLTPADGEAQFRPKAEGLYVLEELLAGRRLDFCLLTSSLSSILGGLKFGAYAAANAFMDAFAHRASRSGGTPWISVNWEGWWFGSKEEAQRPGASPLLKLALSPAEGEAVLEHLLRVRDAAQVAVSTASLAARLDQWVNLAPAVPEPVPTEAQHARPNLTTSFVAPRNAAEVAVAGIWAELLGLREVGVGDDFFELGGHSLLATQLMARLRDRLGVDVPVNRFFELPTVAEQAAFIAELQANKSEKLTEALQRLQALSPEERKRLLERQQGSSSHP